MEPVVDELQIALIELRGEGQCHVLGQLKDMQLHLRKRGSTVFRRASS